MRGCSTQESYKESKLISKLNPWRQPKVKPGKLSSNGGNGINKGFGTD